jgi:hypothetical protein
MQIAFGLPQPQRPSQIGQRVIFLNCSDRASALLWGRVGSVVGFDKRGHPIIKIDGKWRTVTDRAGFAVVVPAKCGEG